MIYPELQFTRQASQRPYESNSQLLNSPKKARGTILRELDKAIALFPEAELKYIIRPTDINAAQDLKYTNQ